jgi:predicted nucleic acid-binding protein
VAVYFLDTSAVVKRYVLETGTAWVQSLTVPTGGHMHFLARITLPEMVAAITRRERGGHITPPNAATALSDFRHDFAHQYQILEITAVLLDQAATLARTYALRGYDAVQLAAALIVRGQVPSLTLISADADLNAAATAEALPVEDPNTHP